MVIFLLKNVGVRPRKLWTPKITKYTKVVALAHLITLDTRSMLDVNFVVKRDVQKHKART